MLFGILGGGVLIVIVLMAMLFVPRDMATVQHKEPPAHPVWPFAADPPPGFTFVKEGTCLGNACWILHGPQFGATKEVMMVVKGQDRDLILKASVWAAEVAFGVDPGTSPAGKRVSAVTDDDEVFVELYPSISDRPVLSPGLRKRAKKEPLRGPFGTAINMPDLPSGPPSLTYDALGLPAERAPESIGYCASNVTFTPYVVAWAGPYKHHEDRFIALLRLTHALGRELPKLHPLLKVLPKGWVFEGSRTHASTSLLVFRGPARGQIRPTLVVVDRWEGRAGPIVPWATVARWAAELATASPLSPRDDSFNAKEIAFARREGQDNVQVRPCPTVAGGDQKFQLKLNETLGLGRIEGGVPVFSMLHGSGKVRLFAAARLRMGSKLLDRKGSTRYWVVAAAMASKDSSFAQVMELVGTAQAHLWGTGRAR